MSNNKKIRICGKEVPANKKICISLPYIYGIGRKNIFTICNAVNIDPNMKVNHLTHEQIQKIVSYISSNLLVEGDLNLVVNNNIKVKREINCYQGVMHKRGLPVRGQRTKNNARTRKGKKKVAAAKKK